MTGYELDNLPRSPTGKRMLSRVSPIYDYSWFQKNFYNAIGLEWDKIRAYFTTFREQHYTETVDWGINLMEHRYSIVPDPTLTLEERRARLKIRTAPRRPLNPGVLEKYALDTFDLRVYLSEEQVGHINLFLNHSNEQLTKFIKWLLVEKPAHLLLDAELILIDFIGTGGDWDSTKVYTDIAEILPKTDDDKKKLPRLYAGTAEAQIGVKTYLPAQIDDQVARVGVSNFNTQIGEKFLSLPIPKILYGNRQVVHAGQYLIRGGDLMIDADLRDLPDYSFINESGIADLLIADGGLARLGEMAPLAQTYDPVYKNKFYFGCVDLVDGNKTLDINKPQDQKIELKVCQYNFRQGSQSIGYDTKRILPTNKIVMRAGHVLMKSGTITIGAHPADWAILRTKENGIADLLIADVGIARPSDVKEEDVEPIDYTVPEGQFLRLYFDFPTGRDKPVLLKNPREDLIVGDVKDVGDIARDDVIFANSRAEGTTGVHKVDLITGFKVTGEESFATLPAGDQLRLFFSFPSGNDHKILANNMRQGITMGELQAIGVQAATNNLLLNSRGQPTSGLTRAAVVKKILVSAANASQPIKFESAPEN